MSNEELVVAIRAGEDRMGELWEQVAGLVKWKANRIMTAMEGFPGRGVEFDDLFQSGYPAMVEAVESYDPTAGAFSTWFMYHLKTAFAEATGYRTKKGRHEPLSRAVSTDKPITDDADSSLLGDFIPDFRAAAALEAVEDREYYRQLHDALEAALAMLPEDCDEVVRLRYYQGMTLEETGRILGVGPERVRQLENKGLRILRRPKNAVRLRSFEDFDFYCSTGLGAFRHSGMSIQERYLIAEEEAQERDRRRHQERENRRHQERIRIAVSETLDSIYQEAEAKAGSMTPEEKRALLERYGYA